MKKTPATMPTMAPVASLRAFADISAFASSISSRMSSEARSDTCVTVSASVVACVSSAGKALKEEGEDETAGKGGSDDELGALVGGRRRGGDGGDGSPGLGRQRGMLDRRLAVVRGGVDGVRHSGGSSPNARTQIIVASRCVAMLASAPIPASRPDQTSRFTR